MSTPRLEINLTKIESNIKVLMRIYGAKNISICAVTKAVCGNLDIARLLVKSGVKIIADSRLENLKKMRRAGIRAQLLLLGPPKMSEIEAIVKYVDISLNTEISVIQGLSKAAIAQGVHHKIVLMIESGDLREGIMPEVLGVFIEKVLLLKGIELIGVGTNLGCFGGVQPDDAKMDSLSAKVLEMEKEFAIDLPFVSGGNSSNYCWFMTAEDPGRINNLRLGESLFLGRETVNQDKIPELFSDAFTLVAEVVELKTKPSVPYGKIGSNAFGETIVFKDLGDSQRAILGVGRQDIVLSGLFPEKITKILGGSSDHIVINSKQIGLVVGSEVRFNVNYEALLSAMTSPYVLKITIPIK